MLARHFAHGLEIAQLQRNRFFGNHRGGLHHFLGGLILAFCVDDFRPAFAFGFGLFGHRAFHAFGQGHFLHFNGGDFDAPRLGLFVYNFLQLLVDDIALRKQVYALQALLFLSMLPLHVDKPRRQLAMLATGLELYARSFNSGIEG